MKKGIFWCKGFDTESPELVTISAVCDDNGIMKENKTLSSKSGENFNHRTEWSALPSFLTEGYPYNYYP